MAYYFLLADLSCGGSERVSVSLARILQHRGADVRFVCLSGGDGELRQWIEPDFQLDMLGARRAITSIPALKRYMRRQSGAVMFSTREHVTIAALTVGRSLGIPVVVRLPNMPSNQLYRGLTGLKWRIIRGVNKHLLPSAKVIIAQTEDMRQDALRCYRLPDDKVVTLCNPLDSHFVKKSAEGQPDPFDRPGTRFLAVCNVHYSKGVDVLLKAFAIVRQSMTDATLTIVGRTDTPYAESLVAGAEDKEHVRFAGFQGNPYPFMRHCDVFVLSSRMEGFPNVLLEAMCFDKPVAATRCVPVVDQIVRQGVNGYTCPTDDPEALAASMAQAATLSGIHNTYDLFDEERFVALFA